MGRLRLGCKMSVARIGASKHKSRIVTICERGKLSSFCVGSESVLGGCKAVRRSAYSGFVGTTKPAGLGT